MLPIFQRLKQALNFSNVSAGLRLYLTLLNGPKTGVELKGFPDLFFTEAYVRVA